MDRFLYNSDVRRESVKNTGHKWVLRTLSGILDHLRSDKFGSQLNMKSETWFFTFLNVYVSWRERDKILISQLSRPKFSYFTDQNGPKGGPHEIEFWPFSYRKMNVTNN